MRTAIFPIDWSEMNGFSIRNEWMPKEYFGGNGRPKLRNIVNLTKAGKLIIQGLPVIEIHRRTGIHRSTISKLYTYLEENNGGKFKCPCGQIARHMGFCSDGSSSGSERSSLYKSFLKRNGHKFDGRSNTLSAGTFLGKKTPDLLRNQP